MSQIVIVDVTEQQAPLPSNLQQFGCFVSTGGTTLTPGTSQALLTEAQLAGILVAPAAIETISWLSEVVSVETSAPHGFTTSDTVLMTIAGVTPTGYNGTFLATITGASTFTYPLTSNPGAETVLGTWVPAVSAELVAENTTWFAQNGPPVAPYVLELGPLGAAAGIAALTAYLVKYPNTAWMPGQLGYFYTYAVPREFAGQTTYQALVNAYVALNKMTYFVTTMTTGNYTNFSSTQKSVIGEVEAPSIPVTEFSAIATMFNINSQQPSSTNKVPNFNNQFQYDVTAYPLAGNASIIAALAAAGVNIVGTGAEGQISNTLLSLGTTMDLNSLNWWYSIDWTQLNINIAVSAAVINGSNTNIDPLYYDQNGIDDLQAVAAGVLSQGVAAGLILGTVKQVELAPAVFAQNAATGVYAGNAVINAVPFTTYLGANPGNYAAGLYGGFWVVMTPQLGFKQIIFQLQATQFAASQLT